MAKLLLNLRHVPDDEADEVRALLKAHGIEYYETRPSRWGVSAGGIWLRHDRHAATAERLMADYQEQRRAKARGEYEAAKRSGSAATLASVFRAHPLQTIAVLLAIALVIALTALPFLMMLAASARAAPLDAPVKLGERPAFLVGDMRDGALKSRLASCLDRPARRTAFSIGHRGAGVRYAEETREAYEAAFRMGAGRLECDVTFTKDLELVCRHSQNDLATTTNILVTPLAATCIRPFRPARFDARGRLTRRASAECRTSEITLAEFKSLRGKIDGFDPGARTPEEFVAFAPAAREGFEPGAATGEVLSHAESIALFRSLGVDMIPELKAPVVRMPFRGFTREQYAQKLIDEYVQAGVDPSRVFPQSFHLADVRRWIERDPAFGVQAVLLDGAHFPLFVPGRRKLARYAASGVRIWAPPIFALVTADADGAIVPSRHARAAAAAGLELVTWTLERSGNIADGRPGFFYRTVRRAIAREGDVYEVLDALARAGVRGVFSDWPATVSLYASCTGQP